MASTLQKVALAVTMLLLVAAVITHAVTGKILFLF